MLPQTSTDPAGKYKTSADKSWLLGKVKAYYSCQGTQVHKKVGLSSNWDSRTSGRRGKATRRTYLDVKLAKASDLQMLCNVKGTWKGRNRGLYREVNKQFSAQYEVKLSATCKAPLAPTRYPKTEEEYTVIGICDSASFDLANSFGGPELGPGRARRAWGG